MAPFKRQKTIHAARVKRRIHSIVPWIQNPLQGVDKQHLVFAPRHEASTLELFFDLFFVANLATFTSYHYIVDHSSLFAYIGFFAIIWVTWFHTVLYDVRFENDSIYSRVCKTIIMIAFVGFALVGSAFAPGTVKGDNTNFRVLCYTLVMSRVLFSIQYLVLIVFIAKARRSDLYLPLSLNTFIYLAATAAYAAMIPSFAESKPVDSHNGIYSIWWIIMSLETVGTIAISSCWRMLSFKKTHLVERMGLLTLIVIGEGAIGVTKTISRMMGKGGLDPEGSGLVLCIVLILVGMWMIYFDHQPHSHFGTIRQQIWSCLHFPIHLAIVGLAEGAQQLALARYVAKSITRFERSVVQYCLIDHLDGEALAEKLTASVKYLQLDKKLTSLVFLPTINEDIMQIGNTTGICGSSVKGTSDNDWPDLVLVFYKHTAAALYSSLGLSMPLNEDVITIMVDSWKLIYRYFWSAFLILIGCFLVVMILIRTTKVDAFDYVALTTRFAVLLAGGVILGLSAIPSVLYDLLGSPAMLPIAVILLYLIIMLDRLGAYIANRRNANSGDPLIGDEHGHGHHEHGHDGHGQGHGHEHHDYGSRGHDSEKQRLKVSTTRGGARPRHGRVRTPVPYSPPPTNTWVETSYGSPETPPLYASPRIYDAPRPPAPVSEQALADARYAPSGYMPVHNDQYTGRGY
ncbi:bacterial low temperature requirement A protein-domain-containing protein [Chaetomium tenue]|uniref:Bacterial low temperature requirement A protein-domain-containing protein n=1 Tax=Chaetomium tenue TaxID=1854479 RepID=A0ACB7PFV9_9PEZI|nr:bacterial low temperature requirement A protein-domain-containing protein [Chaetomium globosum]